MSIYVVYRYSDYRKHNDAEIIGIYKERSTATKAQKEAAEKYALDWRGKISAECWKTKILEKCDNTLLVECEHERDEYFVLEKHNLQ